jgi:hypothetical protein
MLKRIYTLTGAIALIIMIYFIVNPKTIASSSLVWLVTILYAMVIACIHGVLAHSLSTQQKGNLIFYPVLMGILFGIFAFIYIYVVLPLIIPGFM